MAGMRYNKKKKTKTRIVDENDAAGQRERSLMSAWKIPSRRGESLRFRANQIADATKQPLKKRPSAFSARRGGIDPSSRIANIEEQGTPSEQPTFVGKNEN